MFRSTEHALAVAYWLLALPIEPKSPTQLIVEMLRERFDVTYERRLPTGLTPHDWHAQAVMVVSMVERELAGEPLLLAAVRAEYSTGVEMARAIQQVTDYVAPGAGADHLVVDMLVMRLFQRRPTLMAISDQFDIPKTTLLRRERALREKVGGLRDRVLARLDGPMVRCGLVTAAVEALPS